MTRKKTTRPRGGQPGNTNALKHGLYATALPPKYRQNLPQTTAGTVQAEIDLLRLLLANTLTGIAELTPSVPPPSPLRHPIEGAASSSALSLSPLPSGEGQGEGGISINPERDGQSAPSGHEGSTDPFDDSVRFLNIATYTTAAINRLIRLTDDPQTAEQDFWLELSMLADEVRQEMVPENDQNTPSP